MFHCTRAAFVPSCGDNIAESALVPRFLSLLPELVQAHWGIFGRTVREALSYFNYDWYQAEQQSWPGGYRTTLSKQKAQQALACIEGLLGPSGGDNAMLALWLLMAN